MNKEEYWQNRKNKLRGQGAKPIVVTQILSTPPKDGISRRVRRIQERVLQREQAKN